MGTFDSLETLSFAQLEALLRKVPILGDTGRVKGVRGFPGEPDKWRYPYASATIELKKFGEGEALNRSNVVPLSFYVLKDGLDRIRGHHSKILEEHGVDVFDFNNGVCAVRYVIGGVTYLLTPPVIEFSKRDKTNLIIDGLHRILITEESGCPISVIHITNVQNDEGEMPVVALPIEWSQIETRESDTVPKRRYGHDIKPEAYGGHPYAFFRDFSDFSIGMARSAGKAGIVYGRS